MKKVLSKVGLLTLLTVGSMAGDMYGSIGTALTTESGYDSGVSAVATAGMKLDKIMPDFGVEVELSKTLVDTSNSYYNGSEDHSILNVGAYAVYYVKVPNSSFVIKPRLGLNYQNFSTSYSNTNDDSWYRALNDAIDDTFSGTYFSYGVGVTYPLGNLNLYADYTDEGLSSNIGVGVGMAF